MTEELARARAPELVGRIGINLVGPTLLAHGTPEQKARWLSDILPARRAVVPAVQRARRGQRPRRGVDARGAHRAAAGSSTARRCGRATRSSPTGACASPAPNPDVPKQKGISAFVVDMRAPGVEVRPLRQITDESEFNEVFFADVFVPDDQLIGPERRGLARRELDADARARREPAPARDPRPAARGAARGSRANGRVRRPAPRAAARAGLRRGAAVPAAQLALAVARREGRVARARGQRATSCTGAR